MKTLRKTHIIIIAIVLLSFALSAAFYPRLPDRIASHWNAAGQVDDYMPGFWGAFLSPLINAAVAALLLLIPAIDPLKKTAARYIIREIAGRTYVFFEWKSGDYTMRGMKPGYYVLRKEP